jgi:hypothetical protein
MSRPEVTTAAPPAPRFAIAWAALVYAVATLALAYPAFGGGFLVNANSDQYIAGYAFREFAAASLRETGSFPLWNPYLFGGMPYVAAMHGDIFYPTFLLRMIMPTDAAMTWSFVLHLFLAGLFTFGFLRAVGLGFYAALVGGLAYMLGGNVAGLVSPGHDGKLYISALFPLALWVLTLGVRDGRRWAWGVFAIVVGLAVLTPHPQLLQYLLLACGAFALFLAFGAQPRLERPVALRRLGLALVAVVLGGLIGAVQYLPLREYVPYSPRAGGKGWEHAISYSMPPEELISTYLPQFSGILENYWGRNGIHLHSEYLGAAVLVLAALAIGGVRRVEMRRFTWFWIGTLIVTTLWALGGSTPFFTLVYHLVPGTKFFRAPSTILYLVAFATAVLAALGVERALRGEISRRFLGVSAAVAAAVLLLAVSGSFTSMAYSLMGDQRADRIAANASEVVLGGLRSTIVVLVVLAVLAMLRGRRIQPRVAGLALAAIVAVDLWSIARKYWMFSPPAATLYASDPVLDYLQQLPQPGRVVPLGGPLVGMQLEGNTRDPYFGGGDGRAAGLMAHGIRSVAGYHGNEFGRYDALTGWDADWPNRLANPNLWRLLNLQYIYTTAPEAPIPGMQLVAGPARNAAGNASYLYKLPTNNPLAWVAPVAVKAPDESVLATVLDPRFDVASAALFDTAAVVPTQDVSSAPQAIDLPVTVTHYEPGRIGLRLARPAPAGAALVVSENYYPGWKASAGGKELPVGRADYVLIGVGLTPGVQDVELRFQSAVYETGRMITWVALGASLLLAIGGIVTERRRG